ncbi:aminotransferase class V-fold PLP-dependent enzyme [Kiloniella laminariae]|uniref:Cysteine desulfurase n=1 Tax=Kiloniella laminariae TaxID=454162 RepID=A0ABT4LED3_9PROT|nr:aminotransferase class V-fold PLP-dependent enzyme [Kiloniella laminariae]MCZ4279458.1 aminotransferase class V-fold PLP-dependent enzyme [Kiloniella laminariae]
MVKNKSRDRKANRTVRPVYLDYQATTPTDPRVVEAMLPYFYESFGNPHSVDHAYGWEAEEVVDRARQEIAGLIGADPREIIFTSGATESNNLAIKGVAHFQRNNPAGGGKSPARNRIVTTVIEHKCVLESVARLEREGFEVIRLPVDTSGLLDLDLLTETVTDKTALVSVMAVNNEVGVIQNLQRIGEICRAAGAKFHSDAAQAVGKIPLDVAAMNIDLMSISGHKIYGPKGIGALYVRRRPRVRLEALMDGGGQERGLRSGTLPTPLCVGLGKAFALAAEEMQEESKRLAILSQQLFGELSAKLDGVQINGDTQQRIPGNLNLSLNGISAGDLIREVPGLALSMGSACSSAELEPSYVLKALGLNEEQANSSLRIGLGRFTTDADIRQAVELLVEAVGRLRAKN